MYIINSAGTEKTLTDTYTLTKLIVSCDVLKKLSIKLIIKVTPLPPEVNNDFRVINRRSGMGYLEGLFYSNGNPKILIRGGSLSINNQAYAIFDVDGSLQTDFPSYLDPQQVKSISILKSLSATNRYGGIAIGGVIIIKLK